MVIIPPNLLELQPPQISTSLIKLFFKVDVQSQVIPCFSDTINVQDSSLEFNLENLIADFNLYDMNNTRIKDGQYEISLRDPEKEERRTRKLAARENDGDSSNDSIESDYSDKTLKIFLQWTKNPPTNGFVNKSELKFKNKDDSSEDDEDEIEAAQKLKTIYNVIWKFIELINLLMGLSSSCSHRSSK